MFAKFLFRFVATLVAVALLATASQAVDVETVPVGNPGNVDDIHGDGYGSVDYEYRIGTYEVTNGQYTEFLNAVATVGDPNGLYNTDMAGMLGGIDRTGSGTAGNPWVYSEKDSDVNWLNRPVNFVSWGDAARFSNWLYNGQPSGVQGNSTTENGSYELNGANDDTALMAIIRESDATWVIPTTNEWYKAAYYDGDNSVYYDYSTGSDSLPSNDLVNPDPGNNANFMDGPGTDGYTIGGPYYMTKVGDFENSASPYGTFDQGGNLSELNESVIGSSFRGLRGGNWLNHSIILPASFGNSNYPTSEYMVVGFRVALVPEPSTIILLLTGALGFLLYRRR